MARISRVVVPGHPHHVTQRGVRSLAVFDGDADRRAYLRQMKAQCGRYGVEVLAWCLMTNHVHLIAVPATAASLARAVGEAHRRYTAAKNSAAGVTGYLFQGRFGSCVLDESHLLAAARYVELNPVRARMVKDAGEYAWSSARFHLGRRRSDALVADRTLMGLVEDWRGFLAGGMGAGAAAELEKHLSTGRPLGSEGFVRRVEKLIGRELMPRKRGWRKGRKRK